MLLAIAVVPVALALLRLPRFGNYPRDVRGARPGGWDGLQAGDDDIVMRTAAGACTYQVRTSKVVDPTAVE